MSNTLDSLSDDEVRQIALLVETLDKSSFDYLQLEVGNLKIAIGKGNVGAMPVAVPVIAAPAGTAVAVPVVSAPLVAVKERAQLGAQAVVSDAATADGTMAIVAPMMGRFYAKPEPGSPPFVTVGAEVTADSTVGLIEVMKVFTAVRAGVAGVITEISVQDAEFIEYGHVLMRVRPKDAGTGAKGSRKGANAQA